MVCCLAYRCLSGYSLTTPASGELCLILIARYYSTKPPIFKQNIILNTDTIPDPPAQPNITMVPYAWFKLLDTKLMHLSDDCQLSPATRNSTNTAGFPGELHMYIHWGYVKAWTLARLWIRSSHQVILPLDLSSSHLLSNLLCRLPPIRWWRTTCPLTTSYHSQFRLSLDECAPRNQ